MFIWLLVFIAIITFSFFLALRSMVDFRENPTSFSISYSLFLIRNTQNLTAQMLTKWHQTLSPKKLIISLEKLSKGQRSVLVIFGPRQLLLAEQTNLGLVELEEYTGKNLLLGKKSGYILAWNLGKKTNSSKLLMPLTTDLSLEEDEQVWWQLVFQPMTFKKSPAFFSTFRTIIIGKNQTRANLLRNKWNDCLKKVNLFPLPFFYPLEQLTKFYQERSILTGTSKNMETVILEQEEVLNFLGRGNYSVFSSSISNGSSKGSSTPGTIRWSEDKINVSSEESVKEG